MALSSDIVALKHVSRVVRYCLVVLTSLSVWFVGIASPVQCSNTGLESPV